MKITNFSTLPWLLLGLFPGRILAGNILQTDGYSSCSSTSDIVINNFNVSYDRNTQLVTYDVSGSSLKVINVTASLSVSAYGKQVYQTTLDPCAESTRVVQLCPVPAQNFSAQGSVTIPSQYASQIPSIAFTVPDLDGQVKMELNQQETGAVVACFQSTVTNGKTLQVPAVSYIAVGVAGAALALSGLSAATAAGHPGGSSSSPGFGDVVGWFHSVATGGMLSVDYPQVYRSFSANFGFSTALVPWGWLQTNIDNFRQVTGGNLTDDSYRFLKNATLEFGDGSSTNSSSMVKRAYSGFWHDIHLGARDTLSTSNSTSQNSTGGFQHTVSGIQAYVEQLSIPQSNTFMTVLLIFAVVVASIAVGILLLKVILETWALFGTFPTKLRGFRKHYWGFLGRTITNLILILYGIWTLYCIFQFTHGDSWAAKVLAGVTLAIFTGTLAFFTIRIAMLARRYRKAEGDASVLYEDKQVWRRYSLFYDSYKKDYWWLFVPAIVYMFARGCIIAAGDGHGLFQSGGQLIVETLMLILLLWSRPYATKSGQWINLTIQAVRVLSVACILVFVEELGISQTTKTITGIVLIAVQSTLTGLLAILIAVNALITCIRENPHIKRRKHAESGKGDLDDLTPLDARDSLLMDRSQSSDEMLEAGKYNVTGPFRSYREPAHRPRNISQDSTERLIGTQERTSSGSHARNFSHVRSPSPNDYNQRPPGYGYAF